MENKQDLPKFSKKEFDLNTWKLHASGFIHEAPDLSYTDLLELPRVSLTDDFTCLEGWKVEGIHWEGVKLSDVLAILGLNPEMRFIRLSSDDFSIVLSLARATESTTILALRKGGVALDEFHGGPVRLVSKGQVCYESVKALNMIEALNENEEGTAASIALGRIE